MPRIESALAARLTCGQSKVGRLTSPSAASSASAEMRYCESSCVPLFSRAAEDVPRGVFRRESEKPSRSAKIGTARRLASQHEPQHSRGSLT
jgi:hypothetical protein